MRSTSATIFFQRGQLRPPAISICTDRATIVVLLCVVRAETAADGRAQSGGRRPALTPKPRMLRLLHPWVGAEAHRHRPDPTVLAEEAHRLVERLHVEGVRCVGAGMVRLPLR